MEEDGPIRRRINSFTIKLEPIANKLTDEEAISVRNTLESIIQSYFFDVQPWATMSTSESSNDIGVGDGYEYENDSIDGDDKNTSTVTTTNTNTAAAGSVTYVGLAQILENRQTEDNQGVELTMNGLIYFAQGSQDVPDESELLETMERQALSPETVIEALKDQFPSLQLVTFRGIDDEGDSNSDNGIPNTSTRKPVSVTASPTVSPTVEIQITSSSLSTEVPSGVDQIKPSVPTTTGTASSAVAPEQSVDNNDSHSIAPLAAGLASGFIILIAILSLFIVRTKRKKGGGTNGGSHDDGEYLVNLDSRAHLSSSQDNWSIYSNNIPIIGNITPPPTKQESDCDVEKAVIPKQPFPETENSSSSDDAFGLSYLSSFFTRVNPMQQQRQQNLQHEEVRSVSTRGELDNHNDNTKDICGNDNGNSNINNDGSILSDFDDDTVSIQPHIVTLQALESFEDQHKMTRQGHVVQKDMLESSFERINIVSTVSCASSSNLSYSSSDHSSNVNNDSKKQQQRRSVPGKLIHNNKRHRESEEEIEDQRIRNSMMPNPYVRHSYPGTAAATTDRSVPSALTPTDTTAAALGQRATCETESSTGLGMIPKLSAPSWWSSSTKRNGSLSDDHRRNRSSSSSKVRRSSSGNSKSRSSGAASRATDSDDDLAYSGDEENTFGVPSDGWDPVDTELSSLGDAADQNEINMILFHPRVSGKAKQSVPRSLLNNTDSNTSLTRKGSSKMKRKKKSPPTHQQLTLPQHPNSAKLSEYWDYRQDDDNSISSEEINVLKFDSSVDMEI